jgi:hypothetical protein
MSSKVSDFSFYSKSAAWRTDQKTFLNVPAFVGSDQQPTLPKMGSSNEVPFSFIRPKLRDEQLVINWSIN